MHSARVLAVFGLMTAGISSAIAAENSPFTFEQRTDRLEITISGRVFATYVFRDDSIPRPYFRDVHTSAGLRVTRRQPPIKGVDLDDHPTFHPGFWLAFGDLGKADFWRNKARVRHVRFIQEPKAMGSAASFAVENAYENGDQSICTETCRFTILSRPPGRLLLWDSTFRAADREVAFGDQEEMGLGVRVATPLAVVKGGQIRNSDGLINEKQVWGKSAEWCEYSGTLEGIRAGIVVMPHPANFRRSWFHARDYGVLVANPFGRKAFTKGEESRVLLKPNEPFRLRFGLLIFDEKAGRAVDIPAAYQDFLEQLKTAN